MMKRKSIELKENIDARIYVFNVPGIGLIRASIQGNGGLVGSKKDISDALKFAKGEIDIYPRILFFNRWDNHILEYGDDDFTDGVVKLSIEPYPHDRVIIYVRAVDLEIL